MGRQSSRSRALGLGAAVSGLMSILTAGAVGPFAPAPAQAGEARAPRTEARPATDNPTWAEVIRQTQIGGTPSVLVVTSTTVPPSRAYARTLCNHPTTASLRRQVGIAELTVEDEPEQAKRLGVTAYPTLVAYRRGAGGQLESAGVYRGGLSGEAITGWLLGLGLSAGGSPTSASVPPATASRPEATMADPQLRQTQYYPPAPGPSPQQPMFYPAPVPKTAPPTPTPTPPSEPRVVYRRAAPRKQVVTRRVRVVPREVEVVEAPRRRVVREVVEEPAPRSLLTQPREAEPEDVVEVREIEEPAPREAEPEEIVEVREVEAPAPREVVRVREVEVPAPREVVRVREVPVARAAEQPAEVALIQPNVFDRFLGRIGRGLAVRSNPRVAVEARQEVLTLGAAPRGVVIAAPREVAAPCKHGHHCQGRCLAEQPPAPPQAYAYPVPVQAPPYAPSPQTPH